MSRRILLFVVGLTLLALVLGTGGFSAASIDRPVAVDVAEHGESFASLYDSGATGDGARFEWVPLHYRSETPVTPNDSTTRLFVVRNRFDDGRIRVTATGTSNGRVTVTDVETVQLRSGEVDAVTGTVDCHGPANDGLQSLELVVTAEGTGRNVQAEIPYEIQVVCETPERATATGQD